MLTLNEEETLLQKSREPEPQNRSPTRLSSEDQWSQGTPQHQLHNPILRHPGIRPDISQHSLSSTHTVGSKSCASNNGIETVRVTEMTSSSGFTKSIGTIISSINKSVSSALTNLVNQPEHQTGVKSNAMGVPSYTPQQGNSMKAPNRVPSDGFLARFQSLSPIPSRRPGHNTASSTLTPSPSINFPTQRTETISKQHLRLTAKDSSPYPTTRSDLVPLLSKHSSQEGTSEGYRKCPDFRWN